jgi:hypothetical protein
VFNVYAATPRPARVRHLALLWRYACNLATCEASAAVKARAFPLLEAVARDAAGVMEARAAGARGPCLVLFFFVSVWFFFFVFAPSASVCLYHSPPEKSPRVSPLGHAHGPCITGISHSATPPTRRQTRTATAADDAAGAGPDAAGDEYGALDGGALELEPTPEVLLSKLIPLLVGAAKATNSARVSGGAARVAGVVVQEWPGGVANVVERVRGSNQLFFFFFFFFFLFFFSSPMNCFEAQYCQ